MARFSEGVLVGVVCLSPVACLAVFPVFLFGKHHDGTGAPGSHAV